MKTEGASLTSVLETPTLRIELALLLLLCIDDMRSDLVVSFEARSNEEMTSPCAPTTNQIPKASHNLISLDEAGSAAVRRSELHNGDTMHMQSLRRGAVTYFDKWRAAVMGRICDVLGVRGEIVRQAKAKRKQSLIDARKPKRGISSPSVFDGTGLTANYAIQETVQDHHSMILRTFDKEKKVLILHCLLLLLLSLENYSAHSRVLLLRLASSLGLEFDVLAEHEKSVAQGLLATAASQMDAEATTKKQTSDDAVSRKWKVGLAAVGGAVLIGMTGGFAAPLLFAGFGTVMGGLGLGVISTYLGALAGSSVLVGSLFGAYGAKMTSRLMDRYAKEVQDFEFIPIQDPDRSAFKREHGWADEQEARDAKLREQHRLRVCIGISGWLTSTSDVLKPWEVIDTATTEPFALRFELEAMLELGEALHDVLFGYAWDGLMYTVVSRTLLGALYAGFMWPLGLVKIASVLDNPFSVALARADKAGKVLAHALIDGVQGKRPVTLVGYSIGARVINACLLELAEQQAFGLVESAVMMGTPAPSDTQWRLLRSMVAGRVVNVYSTGDCVLGFLYRSAKLELGVAGLQAVSGIHGIENVDMSEIIKGHDQYRYLVGTILAKIGFDGLDFKKIAEQERSWHLAEKRKQRMREQDRENLGNNGHAHTDDPLATPTTTKDESWTHDLIDLDDDSQGPSQNYPIELKQAVLQQAAVMDVVENPKGTLRATKWNSSNTSHLIDDDPHSNTSNVSFASASPQPQISAKANRDFSTPLQHNVESKTSSSPLENADRKETTAVENTADLISILKVGGPAVTATEVSVMGIYGANEYDDDADEVGSEIGELVMVEPVPMDDYDYGLM